MRILIDYRPALRARTGVGEYVHQLARALARASPHDDVTVFTSSWKDRPDPALGVTVPGVRVSDHRVPVGVLNYAWHNLEWPPVEWLTRRRADVVFSPHPLLTPASGAAQVVMVHDLDFLSHPERTVREIRRDYPRLAGEHARRADRVIVPSPHTARAVTRLLDVPSTRIAVCPPGLPEWPERARGFDPRGYLLFFGSLEPRKNVMGLLAAYARLLRHGMEMPPLLLAGGNGSDAQACRDAIARPPFAGRVQHLGYVNDGGRQRLYAGARALVVPSFDEGFGMPALEAMSLGVPVIASARGALPELVGDAGLLIDPACERSLAAAIARLMRDDALACVLSARGFARAAEFSWDRTARAVRKVFAEAVAARHDTTPVKEISPFRSIYADTSRSRWIF